MCVCCCLYQCAGCPNPPQRLQTTSKRLDVRDIVSDHFDFQLPCETFAVKG